MAVVRTRILRSLFTPTILLAASALLLIWCYFEHGVLDCIGGYDCGIFHYLTISDSRRFVVHWPQFHLSVIASMFVVVSAKIWPALIQRALTPIQYKDEVA